MAKLSTSYELFSEFFRLEIFPKMAESVIVSTPTETSTTASTTAAIATSTSTLNTALPSVVDEYRRISHSNSWEGIPLQRSIGIGEVLIVLYYYKK